MSRINPTVKWRGAQVIGHGRVLEVLLASIGLAIVAGIGFSVWLGWFF